MCLVGLAIGASPRFPLVVAANRDEFLARPTAPLGWWSADDGLEVLGGRDLQAGGTWLGLGRSGRIALVTNVREMGGVPPNAPSRGEIVLRWLRGDAAVARDLARYADVNLLGTNGSSGTWVYGGNRPPSTSTRELGRGVYGLSNATIDTPWPKVVALKARVENATRTAASLTALRDALYAALADDRVAADDLLPDTGVGLPIERALSPAFVRWKDCLYGTRSSTVLVSEAGVTHAWERAYGHDGQVTAESYERF